MQEVLFLMVGIGMTYATNDAELLESVLPLVDSLEMSPDALATLVDGIPRIPLDVLETAAALPSHVQLLVHGVGLSLGSHDGYADDYLRLVEPLFSHCRIAWHSEHLGYTRVNGRNLGTMLTLPRTEAAVDILTERISSIQTRFGVPFLVEHVVQLLPDAPAHDYSHAGFLNEITRRTGCGLILDVYNLECDAFNGHLAIDDFLAELDFRTVRELHIANGVIQRGFRLDVHSRRTRHETVSLAQEILQRATAAQTIIFELLPQAVDAVGLPAILEELQLLRGKLAA